MNETTVITAEPGINLRLLKPDTVLILEGESELYELTMRYPEHGIAEVNSNNPALREPAYGQFMGSLRLGHPGVRLNVIQKDWAMVLRFRNGEFLTQPILAASISGRREDGSRWSYEVFGSSPVLPSEPAA
jgi:hypothetical protein